MIEAEESSKTCRLCSALELEIEKTHATGDSERKDLLKFLLKGHQEACHGSR